MNSGNSHHFLNGWKEIADYLGRGVRTVQRWEEHYELPIRRAANEPRSAVIAYIPDLDAWVQNRKTHDDAALAMVKQIADLEAENEALKLKNKNLEMALRMVMERKAG